MGAAGVAVVVIAPGTCSQAQVALEVMGVGDSKEGAVEGAVEVQACASAARLNQVVLPMGSAA